MRDMYGSAIYWHQGVPHAPRPALTGSATADVVVIGGGFTGLWTAYHLIEADPSLRIVVLEGEEIGFGASGRNGGFAMTLLDMSLAHLHRNYGTDAARLAHDAVAESVAMIGRTVADEGIDCEWKHGGLMSVATNAGQMHRLRADLDAAVAMGLGGFDELTAAQARAEVDSPTYVGAVTEEHCAVLHPAKLAHGLAEAISRRGVEVHETSHVTAVAEGGSKMRVTTPDGTITADQVVLATNAWARNLPWFSSKVVALYTYILLTEPLTEKQWASVGWASHQGIEDKRNFVHYYRRTLDGRILWGGRDGVIHAQLPRRPGIRPVYDRSRIVSQRLAETFRATFPQLAAVRFTHHWGGPVGITAQFLPHVGSLEGGRVHYGHGYNGHGVAPTHAVGRVLAERILGHSTDLQQLCFVDPKEPAFPPDPLLWASAELTRRSLLRQDRRMDGGAQVGDMDPLLLRIMNALS